MMRALVIIIAFAACRSQSAPPSPAPTPARVAQVLPPAPALVVEPLIDTPEELPWVDPDEPKVGTIAGLVTDVHGEAMPGATLIATSESMLGAQTAISEEDGSYLIEDLAPDDYLVTLYFVDHSEEHHVTVGDDVAELSLTLDPDSFPPVVFIGCGGGNLENTYVVDGIDTSGLTFGE